MSAEHAKGGGLWGSSIRPAKQPMYRHRVLLVDDEERGGQLMASCLRREGLSVTFCDLPREALRLVRGAPEDFDCVVTDVNMPQMDGFELGAQLRALVPALPIAIMTGNVSALTVNLTRTRGFGDLMRKPLAPEALSARVHQMLGGLVRSPF